MAELEPATDTPDVTIEVIALLANPATSYWLRDALVSALDRDPFDAERDALALSTILTRNLDALVARHFLDRAET
ncbi:hypothetical protein HJG53_14160 [Sphingomonas sp. ID1715]|uniref:hypothetical protein n=1 Tax=Sphingomonas sp. ID1715 TaxID=1656898 RepID=UPI001487AC9A|nr:hypothetical protein [Sphingomonas sp. ID1715]NNM78047.1 hypothetical protein [Sphingomonas sp. ID1715]